MVKARFLAWQFDPGGFQIIPELCKRDVVLNRSDVGKLVDFRDAGRKSGDVIRNSFIFAHVDRDTAHRALNLRQVF